MRKACGTRTQFEGSEAKMNDKRLKKKLDEIDRKHGVSEDDAEETALDEAAPVFNVRINEVGGGIRTPKRRLTKAQVAEALRKMLDAIDARYLNK